MALKNTPDFTSESRDETSIQDHIDNTPVLNASRTDITLLEKEIFSKIDTVTVHTFDPGDDGRLIVRTGDVVNTFVNTDTGKRINDDQSLSVINTDGNDHLIAENGKLYIHVALPGGGTGYVSADYVKSPIPLGTPESRDDLGHAGDPELIEDDEAPVVELTTPDLGHPGDPDYYFGTRDDEAPVDDNLDDDPVDDDPVDDDPVDDDPVDDDPVEEAETLIENLGPSYTMLSGTVWLAHEDGEDRIIENPIMQSVEEVYPGLSEYVAIWKLKSVKTVDGMWFKGHKDLDENIEASSSFIEEQLGHLSIMINSPIGRNDAAEKVVIEDIFAEMAKYGDDVLENNERVADLFLNGSSLTEEEKLTQMYGLSRIGMSQNGDSTLVEEFVVNRLMKKPKFEEVAKLLNDPSIIDMMIHGGTSNNSLIKAEIMSRFSFNDEEVDNIMEEIAKSASTIRREVYDEVNYNLLSIEVDKANEELAARGETLLNLRDVAEAQVRGAMSIFMKNSLTYKLVAKESFRGGETDSLQGLYANMKGLGETSGWDWYYFEDSKIEPAINLSLIAITSLLPLGAGALAASAVIRGAGYLVSTTRVAKVAESTNKYVRGAGAVGAWGGNSAVGGLAFYQASNPIQNWLRGDGRFFGEGFLEGWDDTKEISKSIAFFGALGALRPIMGRLGSTKIGDKMNANMFTRGLKGTGSVLLQAGTLVGVSQAIEVSFGDSDDFLEGFTLEEFVQALIMIAALKGAGRYADGVVRRFEMFRGSDGKIRLKQSAKRMTTGEHPGVMVGGVRSSSGSPREPLRIEDMRASQSGTPGARSSSGSPREPLRIEDMRASQSGTPAVRGSASTASGRPTTTIPRLEALIPRHGLQTKFQGNRGKDYFVRIEGSQGKVTIHNSAGKVIQGNARKQFFSNTQNRSAYETAVNNMNASPRNYQNDIIPKAS